MKYLLLIIFLIPAIAMGQKQIQIPLQSPCPFGYLEYRPACESVTENCQTIYKCPAALLINLTGWGERGNGITDLSRVANAGVSKLIKDGNWNRTDFIVVSPQLFTGQKMYSPAALKVFIDQMRFKYQIKDVYMVGLSAGANSIYSYILQYDDVKAVICIAGAGAYKQAYKAVNTRLWAFHGENDDQVPAGPDRLFVKNYNYTYDTMQVKPAERARLTYYPGVGHYGWQQTYSGEWLDKPPTETSREFHRDNLSYDHFNEDVFNWLLK